MMSTQPAGSLEASASLRAAYIVVILGFGAFLFEGYDLIVYGSAVPALLAYPAWALTPAKVGAIGGVVLLGMFVGAPLAGWLSDRLGRRRMFIGLLSFFSFMMMLVAVAPTPGLFALFRFLAGIGIAGIPPTAIAQVFEFAPDNRKVLFNAIMLGGFGVGAIVAPAVSLLMIGHVGFRGLFAFGALPLVTLVPLAAFFLPDVPAGSAHAALETPALEKVSSWRGVLRGRAALSTVLFAAANSFALLLSFALNTWLPQLMRGAGYPLGSALQFLLLLNIGSLCGGLLGGWISDRVGGRKVLVGMFVIAAVSLGCLAIPGPAAVLKLLVFIAGAVACGNQSVLFSMMAAHYPQTSRATAVGVISGVACLGAAAGPLLGGLLIKAGASLSGNVLVFGGIALLAGLAIVFVPSRLADLSTGFDRA